MLCPLSLSLVTVLRNVYSLGIDTLVLHPGMRTEYFNDPERGDAPELASKAESILEHIYLQYVDECPEFKDFKSGKLSKDSRDPTMKKSGGFFAKSIRASSSMLAGNGGSLNARMRAELDKFFSGAYTWEEGTKILDWWKVCGSFNLVFLMVLNARDHISRHIHPSSLCSLGSQGTFSPSPV